MQCKTPARAFLSPHFARPGKLSSQIGQNCSKRPPGRVFSLNSPHILLGVTRISMRSFRKTAITLATGLRLRRAIFSSEALSNTKTMVAFMQSLDVIPIDKFMFESNPSCNIARADNFFFYSPKQFFFWFFLLIYFLKFLKIVFKPLLCECCRRLNY